jgi:hypothetical protein
VKEMDRNRTPKFASAVLLFGLVLLSTAMAAEDYQIAWTRPNHPGQKIHIKASAGKGDRTVLSGAVSQTTELIYEVRLTADEEILEVDKAG